MARFAVGYLADDSLWSEYTAGSIYSIPMTRPVASVTANGTAYTAAASLAAVTTSKFYHDEDDGVLYVAHASAPNASDSDVVIVDYWMFVTEGVTRYAGSDPTSSPTGSYEYEPRLLNSPSISQSFENALAGILTISASSITMANADGWIQPHLSASHSLCERQVILWQCIDSTENVARVFTGRIRTASISDRRLSLSLFDDFSSLGKPAYMGDRVNEAFLFRSADSWPSLAPSSIGRPCKYIVGPRSYANFRGGANTHTTDGPMWYDAATERAACVDYGSAADTSKNRNWILCRIPGNTLRTQTVGTLEAHTIIADPFIAARFSTHDLQPGEHLTYTHGGNTHHARVYYNRAFTYSGTPYNVILHKPYSGAPQLDAVGLVFVPAARPALFRFDSKSDDYGDPISPSFFSTSFVPTSGGNSFVKVTFTAGYGAIDPEDEDIGFQVFPSDSALHGDVASRMLSSAGLTVDSASVDAANVAVPVNAMFSIPNVDEDTYRTSREYLQDLLASVGAYTVINTEGDAEYHVLETPAAGTEVTALEMLGNASGLTIDVDYNDVTYELKPFNPHCPTWETNITGDNPEEYASDAYSRYLHDRSQSLDFRHVLETITDRIEYLLSLRSAPRKTYRFETATAHIDANLGEDCTLTDDEILGGSGSTNLKIVGLDKSPDSVTTTAVELP
jgi:hypothetical protein